MRAMILCLMCVLASMVALAAQAVGGDTGDVTSVVPELTSVAAVIVAAVGITAVIKPSLGSVPYLSQVPLWCYLVLISLGLTWVANQVMHTLEGDFLMLAWRAFYSALAASGVREVFKAGVGKPVAQSGTGGGR